MQSSTAAVAAAHEVARPTPVTLTTPSSRPSSSSRSSWQQLSSCSSAWFASSRVPPSATSRWARHRQAQARTRRRADRCAAGEPSSTPSNTCLPWPQTIRWSRVGWVAREPGIAVLEHMHISILYPVASAAAASSGGGGGGAGGLGRSLAFPSAIVAAAAAAAVAASAVATRRAAIRAQRSDPLQTAAWRAAASAAAAAASARPRQRPGVGCCGHGCGGHGCCGHGGGGGKAASSTALRRARRAVERCEGGRCSA